MEKLNKNETINISGGECTSFAYDVGTYFNFMWELNWGSMCEAARIAGRWAAQNDDC